MISQFLKVLGAELSSIKPGDLPHPVSTDNTIAEVLSVVFAIIGAFALLMITVSGLRYILAGGDTQKISKAKNGIIYSLAGLIIAISAQAIVLFVVKNL